MKTILCPTDFSDTAKNASVFAAQLAQDIDAKIHLINILHVPVLDPNTTLDVLDSLMQIQRDASSQKLNSEVERLREFTSVEITYSSDFGLAVDGITEKAQDIGAFLTVMGTNGESGVVDRLMGTVSNGVVNRNKIPTLVVPNNSKYVGLRQIAFTDDHQEDLSEQLEFIFNLNKNKRPKIDVVSVASGDEYKEYTEEIISSEGGVTEICVWSKDIESGLNSFVREHNSQLLVLKRHHRGFFEELFHKSTTKSILGDISIPTLVFN